MNKISPLEDLKNKVELLEDGIAGIQEGAYSDSETQSSVEEGSEGDSESGTPRESS